MHLTASPIDWYAARAAGIVAYLLLTAVVAIGVGLAGRMNGNAGPASRSRTCTASAAYWSACSSASTS